MNTHSQRTWYNHWIHFLALGFGSGALPKAPGTFGTLAAIPLYLVMANLSTPIYLIIVLIGFIAGIYICQQASNDMKIHDPGCIVWDEIIGFWITMAALPMEWTWIVAGFILFRLFDITKPFPINWIDKNTSGGFGIMIDDVIAGIFASFMLHTVHYAFS